MLRAVYFLLAALLILIGLDLLFGGLQLAIAGGSYFYLLAGAALAASGLLLFLKQIAAARVYAVAFLATVAWSFAEAGHDLWALMPRLALFTVILLAFLGPKFKRFCGISNEASLKSVVVLPALNAAAVGLLWHYLLIELPADPAFRTGVADTIPDMSPVEDSYSGDWPYWGYDRAGTRFSARGQITPENVDKLDVAWVYRTGPDRTGYLSPLEVTPVKVDETVYRCTNYNDVIALDAHTGTLCPGFGDNGVTSLLKGMGEVRRGYYHPTSAPTVARGNIIVVGMVAYGQYWGEYSGVIQAYDAVSAEFVWAFDVGHLDLKSGQPAGDVYTRATPNSCTPRSIDEKLGLVYAPTANATPDYYGTQRREIDNAFSSFIVAIDAKSAELAWSFQTVQHDLWDYDVPSPTHFQS